MITFFHTADVHFGVENYGRIDPKTGIHSRLLDFKKNLDECINQAIEQNIDFFLLCGDAYKTAYPTPTQQKLLMECLLRLHQAAIPVIIVVGNHDHPLSFGKAHALDIFSSVPLNNFYVFSKPESITIQTKNGPVQIVGIPWPTRNTLVSNEAHRFKDPTEITSYISEKIGSLIQSFAASLNPHIPAILCGHLTVSSGIFSGSEKTAVFGTDPLFLPSQLAIHPFDYVALGHLHRHQNLNAQGYPPLVYSGSIERVDFGERKEEKGFCKVIINTKDNTKSCSYEFIKVKSRPMIQIDVYLQEGTDQTEQIISEIKTHDLSHAIVKILYYLPEGKIDKVDLNAVLRSLSNAHYIVGVFPVHKITSREKRAQVTNHMDFDTLLKRYFSSKQELNDKQQSLLKKAHDLKEKLTNDHPEETTNN